MSAYIKPYLFVTYLFLILSCTQKDNRASDLRGSMADYADKGLAVCYDGVIAFRRTFADIQFMDNEKEQDKYIAKQEKTNPVMMYGETSPLLQRFEEFGFVKNGQLLQYKFNDYVKNEIRFTEDDHDFPYTSASGKKINIRFKHVANGRENNFISTNRIDSVTIKTDFFDDLKCAVLNILPGGNKEIVVLKEYYIMNGYNFELMVYQISGL